MDEKVKDKLDEIKKESVQGCYLFNPPAQLFQASQNIKYLLSLLSEKEKHEEDYQHIIREILLCSPISACDREDDRLEPPWEVVARMRKQLSEREKEIGELKSIINRLQDDGGPSFE